MCSYVSSMADASRALLPQHCKLREKRQQSPPTCSTLTTGCLLEDVVTISDVPLKVRL